MSMTHQVSNSGDTPPDDIVEFHSDDDAWYPVRLVLSEDILTVKYCNLPDVYDEPFNANCFKTQQEVEDFGERFRPVSPQLQDSECRKAFQGVMVSASIVFSEEDVRFYDACVQEVEYKEHSFAKGEEECLCGFILLWQHGPYAGNRTSSTIEHISLIQPCMQLDPTVSAFLKISRDKLKNISPNAGLVSEDNGCKDGANHTEIFCSYSSHKSRPKETKSAKQSESIIQETEGSTSICREWIDEDMDRGGEDLFMGNKHILLIENMEKDLSKSTVVEFIHKLTNISTEAFVIPSLSSETYTRGIIVVDCKEKLEKLYAFLDNPGHLIVSSRGRPWVIYEKSPNNIGVSITVMPISQTTRLKGSIGNCGELRVVLSGNEEYTTAKKRRDLLIEFLDHQKQMHTRLDWEMRKILQTSDEV